MKNRDHSIPSPGFDWKPKRPVQTRETEPEKQQLKLRIPLQKPRKEGK